MSKFILGIGAVLASASAGFAQDMPLFTFAKLGAKWDPTEYRFATGTVPLPAGLGDTATCAVVTKDGATMFAGFSDRAAVWAYPVKKDGKPDLTAGAPYAPLRIGIADETPRPGATWKYKGPPLAVTALMIDPAGRIYAGTPKGIQVFDPTGRLCGVLPLPKAGTVRGLEWRETPTRGLALVLDGTVFVREMK